jgi:hypothetical protein
VNCSLDSILREHKDDFFSQYDSWMTVQQKKAYNAISQCQTGDLGSTIYLCKSCKKTHEVNSSCGNRHCPLCQGNKTIEWVESQMEKVLPVPYFLLTFTVPKELRDYIYKHQKEAYAIMLEAASATIKKLLLDEKFMGADLLGFISIIHTWGGMLQFHPHIHVLIPCGGLNRSSGEWKDGRVDFLFPVEAASDIWRAKLIHEFKKRIGLKGIKFRMMDKEFIVHAKPAGNGLNALKYLARYVFRVAIDNRRIVKVTNGKVYFWYRKKGNAKSEIVSLKTIEFIRRFMQHILPRGFMKVRHNGFLHSNSKISIIEVRKKVCDKLHILIQNLPKANTQSLIKIPICKHCGSELVIVERRDPIKEKVYLKTG